MTEEYLDKTMSKLLKLYIIKNPNCTSSQISNFFNENNFGLKKKYTSRQIGTLIKNSNNRYKWFNVQIIRRKGKVFKYKCIQ